MVNLQFPPNINTAFGVDVGGSGIKGAPVNLTTGELRGERVRVPTPGMSTPEAVVDLIAHMVEEFDVPDEAPLGIAIPAPIVKSVVPFIANLDQSWVDTNIDDLLTERLGRPSVASNDADAAGVAELKFGAAQHTPGTVAVFTLGTGIGSALIVDGQLMPNTELGHLEIDGHDAETRAAASAREREQLDWEAWAKRLQRYFDEIERLFYPDVIVIGGGVSRNHEEFLPLLRLRARVEVAQLRNTAGIVGAASLAAAVAV